MRFAGFLGPICISIMPWLALNAQEKGSQAASQDSAKSNLGLVVGDDFGRVINTPRPDPGRLGRVHRQPRDKVSSHAALGHELSRQSRADGQGAALHFDLPSTTGAMVCAKRSSGSDGKGCRSTYPSSRIAMARTRSIVYSLTSRTPAATRNTSSCPFASSTKTANERKTSRSTSISPRTAPASSPMRISGRRSFRPARLGLFLCRHAASSCPPRGKDDDLGPRRFQEGVASRQ